MSNRALGVAAWLGAHDLPMRPGQDGIDCHFVTDYRQSWTMMVDAAGEAADDRLDVKLLIEYGKQELRAALQVGVDRVLYYLDTVFRLDTAATVAVLRRGAGVRAGVPWRACWYG